MPSLSISSEIESIMNCLTVGLPKSNIRNFTSGLSVFPSKLVVTSPINQSGCSIVSGVPTTARSGSNHSRNLINPPVSRVQKPVFFAEYLKLIYRTVRAIPSGVHPEILKADFFLGDLLDKFQTRGCLHPAPAQMRYGQNDRLPVILGGMVFQDVPPQDVMGVNIISFPRKQEDLRGANLLAGMQREVCRLHAGTESN